MRRRLRGEMRRKNLWHNLNFRGSIPPFSSTTLIRLFLGNRTDYSSCTTNATLWESSPRHSPMDSPSSAWWPPFAKDRLLPSLRPNSALTGPCRSGRVDIALSEVGRQCTTKGTAHQKSHLRQVQQSCAQSYLEPISDIGSKHPKEDFWT